MAKSRLEGPVSLPEPVRWGHSRPLTQRVWLRGPRRAFQTASWGLGGGWGRWWEAPPHPPLWAQVPLLDGGSAGPRPRTRDSGKLGCQTSGGHRQAAVEICGASALRAVTGAHSGEYPLQAPWVSATQTTGSRKDPCCSARRVAGRVRGLTERSRAAAGCADQTI